MGVLFVQYGIFISAALHGSMEEENNTSLSEFHDYEPSLEFDDTELIQAPGLGKFFQE